MSVSTVTVAAEDAIFELETLLAEVAALPAAKDPEATQRRHNRLARLTFAKETIQKLSAGRVKGRPAPREVTTELPEPSES